MSSSTVGVVGMDKLGCRIVQRLIDTGTDPRMILAVRSEFNRAQIVRLGVRGVSVGEMQDVGMLILAVKRVQLMGTIASLGFIDGVGVVSFVPKISANQLSVLLDTTRVASVTTTPSCMIGRGVGVYAVSSGADFLFEDVVQSFLGRLGQHDRVYED